MSPPATGCRQWDIKEDKDSFKIVADIPGGSQRYRGAHGKRYADDPGREESEKKDEREGYKRRAHPRQFYRRFSLPDTADANKISAKSNHGVLEVTIGKQEKASAAPISVNSRPLNAAMRRPGCHRATLISRQQASIDGLQRLLCGDGRGARGDAGRDRVPTAAGAQISPGRQQEADERRFKLISERGLWSLRIPELRAAYDQLAGLARAGQEFRPPGWDAGSEFSGGGSGSAGRGGFGFLREPVRTGWQFPQCRLHLRGGRVSGRGETIMPGSRSALEDAFNGATLGLAAYPGIRCTWPTQ